MEWMPEVEGALRSAPPSAPEVSWASSPGVRKSMQANRPKDTAVELAVRSALHRAGLRFRKHVRPVEGLKCQADVVFRKERLAVFVDGCFWHGCPEHATRPVANGAWWAAKLDRTIERDRANRAALEAAGWTVLRIWEHEDVGEATRRVAAAVTHLRSQGPDR